MKKGYIFSLILSIIISQFSIFIASAQPCIPNPNSIDFDGNSTFVRINSLNGLDITNQLTIEAWIYPKSFASGPAGNSIFCKHAWGSSMYGYVLRCGGTGQLSFNFAGAVNNSPVGWQEVMSNSGALVLNTWQHVAGTFDGNMLAIYINGVLAGTYPFTGTIYPSTGYKARIGALADTVWSMSRYFHGLIDEVRVWNRALSPLEIINGMNDHIDPATQTGLVGYWRFNDGTGTLVDDLGSGNNNGTLFNGVWSTQVPFNNNSLPTPTITWVSPNLVSSYANGNQWYFRTTLISGATQQTYAPTQYGYYKVVVTDSNNCTAISLPFYYNTTGLPSIDNQDIMVTPNPVKNRLTLSVPPGLGEGNCTIFSITGDHIKSLLVEGNNPIVLDISELESGLYLIMLTDGKHCYQSKFIKTEY